MELFAVVYEVVVDSAHFGRFHIVEVEIPNFNLSTFDINQLVLF